MENQHSRTEMLLGTEGVAKLKRAKVIVFGVGGVGGYAVEALARSGVGEIHLVDSDRVSLSNINRQIIATHKTLGFYKTQAAEERILSINPECKVKQYTLFFDGESQSAFDFSEYDYVIDAIDSLKSKILLISAVKEANTPIISAMGAGNKLDPTKFEVTDISKTEVCPLAKATRTALRKIGINHLKVVYSKEQPKVPAEKDGEGRVVRVPASVSFVPSVMGLIIAGEVIKDIIKKEKGEV